MRRVPLGVALVVVVLLAAMRPVDAFPKREWTKCIPGDVCSGRPSPCLRVPVATGTMTVCGPGARPGSAGWIGLLLDGLTCGDPTARAELELDGDVELVAGRWSRSRGP